MTNRTLKEISKAVYDAITEINSTDTPALKYRIKAASKKYNIKEDHLKRVGGYK
jgi:hypothetical protein